MYTQLIICPSCYCFPPIADREVQRILLELLNQMEGFDQSVNVKVSTCTCLVHVCFYMCQSTEITTYSVWIEMKYMHL